MLIGKMYFFFKFQKSIDDAVNVWNCHRIRPSTETTPYGRPHLMYTVPASYDTHDYGEIIDLEKLDDFKALCEFKTDIPCDPDLAEMCDMVMANENYDFPTDAQGAKHLYLWLKDEIDELL